MNVTKEMVIAEAAGIVEQGYWPNDAVIEHMGHVDLTIPTGPSGSGKNTIMSATGLPIVVGETIRDPRMNNGILEMSGREYHFRGDDLSGVLADLRARNYVQIGMGPSRTSFYASRIQNYPDEGPALKDLMTNQVEGMRALPFSSVQAVHIVPPSPQVWLERLDARGTLEPAERHARIEEAGESVNDALTDGMYLFLINDELKTAAGVLRAIAERRPVHSDVQRCARSAAVALYEYLERTR